MLDVHLELRRPHKHRKFLAISPLGEKSPAGIEYPMDHRTDVASQPLMASSMSNVNFRRST